MYLKYFLFTTLLTCLFYKSVSGQESGKGFFEDFFNEFSVSLNRTDLRDDNSGNGFGFGIGTYYTYRRDRKLNILLGFEYNRTSLHKKYIDKGRFAHLTDVSYKINNLSIQPCLRFNIGSKTKIFIEAGGFTDIVLKSRYKGTLHSSEVVNNQLISSVYKTDGKAALPSSAGIYFGLGVRIPMSGFELVIKPDYKMGLTNWSPDYYYQYGILSRYFRLNLGVRFD